MGLETSVWIFSSLAMVKQIFQTDSVRLSYLHVGIVKITE
jgi:hypothetical protein